MTLFQFRFTSRTANEPCDLSRIKFLQRTELAVRIAADSAQQLVSMHASQVASPDERPQLAGAGPPGGGGGGGGPPPVQALQFVVTHDERVVSSVAPAGWAVWHAASHAASRQLSRQLMKSVQSLSLMHDVTSPQQVVVRHASHVG